MASIRKGTPLSSDSLSVQFRIGKGAGATAALVKLLQEHLVNRLTELESNEKF
jgi:hypothetical protein